jgi:spermidine synthase
MKKNFLGKKWFFEDFLPGEPKTSTWGFKIEKEIFSGESKFQKIEIFQNKEFGKILALDGMVQLSTKDEFVYHEMLVHPAILSHQNPKRVLIIGGGDGGALREVSKHPVKEIYLVDIDKKVIEVSKKYLPEVSKGAFKDKRLKIFIEDALKFIKGYKNYFDIIIEDLTDPTLITKFCWNIKFYKDIQSALKKDGVAGFQSGYLKEPFAKKARRDLAKVFPFFVIHKAFVGCFPMDEHTFSFGSKKINFNKISFKDIEKKFKKLKLKTKYYSPKIHFYSKI